MTAKRIWAGAVILLTANMCWALTLPYSTGFESPEWTAGDWNSAVGQNGWTGNSVTLLGDAGKAYEGDQCLRFGYWNGYSGSLSSPEITGEPETDWLMIEVMVNHGFRDDGAIAGDTQVLTTANDGYYMFRLKFNASTKILEVQNGISTGVAFDESTWYKVTILINQGSGVGNKAYFYIDDELVAGDVASMHYVSTGLEQVILSGGSHQSGATGDHYSYMDNLTVEVTTPPVLNPNLPYVTGFEAPEFVAGDINGQNDWVALDEKGIVRANSAEAFEGEQVLRLGHWNGYGGAATTPAMVDEPVMGRLAVEFMVNHGRSAWLHTARGHHDSDRG